MALSDSVLSGLIKSEIIGKFGPALTDAELKKFCDALAKAVVDHITASAQVSVTVTGVTPGPGSASGTGTVS